jgi:hypothetical protein
MKLNDDRLCYLDASKVLSPAGGGLSRLDLRSPDDQILGNLEGVIIDPTERRLRYFVVESSSGFRIRRYLVPVDGGARVESDSCTLRLDVAPDDLSACEEFDGSVREFSDEDLVAATFARHTA